LQLQLRLHNRGKRALELSEPTRCTVLRWTIIDTRGNPVQAMPNRPCAQQLATRILSPAQTIHRTDQIPISTRYRPRPLYRALPFLELPRRTRIRSSLTPPRHQAPTAKGRNRGQHILSYTPSILFGNKQRRSIAPLDAPFPEKVMAFAGGICNGNGRGQRDRPVAVFRHFPSLRDFRGNAEVDDFRAFFPGAHDRRIKRMLPPADDINSVSHRRIGQILDPLGRVFPESLKPVKNLCRHDSSSSG